MNNSPSEATDITKRPPTRQRKSTLTQQQKNKKRQRATPHQLTVLKSEFEVNQTPNAKAREDIGRRIDMTERSVQIWFQNKRAKNKILAKKQGPNFPQNIQFAMGTPFFNESNMMAHLSNNVHANISTDSFPSPFVTGTFSNLEGSQPNHMLQNVLYSPASMSQLYGMNQQKIHLPCVSLTIGKWRRAISPTNHMSTDLQVVYSPAESIFTYTIFTNSTGYRIQYPLQSVKTLEFTPHAGNPSMGDINVKLFQAPRFFIHNPKLPTWVPCDDFSEMKQASLILDHKLSGNSAQLQTQLAHISRQGFNQTATTNSIVRADGIGNSVSISNNNFPLNFSAIANPEIKADDMMMISSATNSSALSATPSESANMLSQSSSMHSMNVSTSPETLSENLQDGFGLGIFMKDSTSKPSPSLFEDDFINADSLEANENNALSLDTSEMSTENISYGQGVLENDNSMFCLNNGAGNNENVASSLSFSMDNLNSDVQMTTTAASEIHSPSNFNYGNVEGSNNATFFGLTPSVTNTDCSTQALKVLSLSDINNIKIPSLNLFSNNLVDGSLPTPITDTISTSPSKNVDSKKTNTTDFFSSYIENSNQQTSNQGNLSPASKQLFEGARAGATDMMMSGTIEQDITEATEFDMSSENENDMYISLDDVEGDSIPTSDFNGELDGVVENISSDSSLLSLIHV